MNKKQIRLTESDLKQIVKESVNMILNEAYGTASKSDDADYENFTPYNSYNGKAVKGMNPGGNVGFHDTMAFREVMSSLKNAKHYASIGAGEQAWLKNVPFEEKTMIQKYYSHGKCTGCGPVSNLGHDGWNCSENAEEN